MPKENQVVEELVASFLEKSGATLSARERRAAVRAFLDAGKAALQARAGTVHDAADAARIAKRLLHQARHRMSRAAKREGPGVIVDREWKAHRRALDASRERLRALPGVVGYGVGRRKKGMLETEEPTVVVYVRRKLTPAELRRARGEAIPRSLPAGGKKQVATDIVELGDFERLVDAGCSIGPLGSTLRGTLGTFAEDDDTGRLVALTAMHVTGLGSAFPPGSEMRLCAPFGGSVLGTLLRGTMQGVDAAKVAVDSPPPASTIESIGQVRGWRPASVSGDQGTTVRMFGAESRLLAGRIENPSADLPGENLTDAILVNLPTVKGDSGAAIVDNGNLVLGLLAGRFNGPGGEAVFSPIGPVLKALRCDIPPS
jgi:hypothetical protein